MDGRTGWTSPKLYPSGFVGDKKFLQEHYTRVSNSLDLDHVWPDLG